MATSYPSGIDNFTNPTSTDTLDSATVPHATQHANANDAIEAIEAELGTNPKGAKATVKARLDDVDTSITGKVATTTTISTTAPIAGGGDLSANRTLSLNIGSSLTTSASNLIVDSTIVPYLASANTFTTGQTINGAASGIGLVVKANATTPGNLQEWRDSTPTTLASISSSGQFNIPNIYVNSSGGGLYNVAAGSYMTFPATGITFNPYATTKVGLIVKGAASQTANLQEWQNSAGTALVYVASNGVIRGSGTANAGASGTSAPQFDSNGTFTTQYIYSLQGFTARQTVATQVPMTVRGATTQSANLMEIQTSASAILTSVTSAGTINFQTGNTSSTATIGAITAPVMVAGYITMQVAGTTVKVPYYNN